MQLTALRRELNGEIGELSEEFHHESHVCIDFLAVRADIPACTIKFIADICFNFIFSFIDRFHPVGPVSWLWFLVNGGTGAMQISR